MSSKFSDMCGLAQIQESYDGQLVMDMKHSAGHSEAKAGEVTGAEGEKGAYSIGEDDAIYEAPSNVGKGDVPEDLPIIGPQCAGRLLLSQIHCLQYGDELTGYKWQCHKDGCQSHSCRPPSVPVAGIALQNGSLRLILVAGTKLHPLALIARLTHSESVRGPGVVLHAVFMFTILMHVRDVAKETAIRLVQDLADCHYITLLGGDVEASLIVA